MQAFTSCLFQLALPLRGATHHIRLPRIGACISIRAPLAGSDAGHPEELGDRQISIRAPLAGSDRGLEWCRELYADFNPRSPCGERRGVRACQDGCVAISIRAPLAGSDVPTSLYYPAEDISIRAPLAGSDGRREACASSLRISIRAPLAGSDKKCRNGFTLDKNFNPRSPCGERRSLET